MNHHFKVAMLGSTGKSGQYVVKALIEQGFQLKLLLRNPAKFLQKTPSVEIIQGDARNYESIRSLLEGCNAVVSTLGQPKGEPAIFSTATRNVIRAMHEHSIKRYIVTTGLNVDTPSDKKGTGSKAATDWMKSTFPETTNDKQVEYEVLSQSAIDWTLIRLPLIRQTGERGKVEVSVEDCPGKNISAADLAAFVVDVLKNSKHVKEAPFIANQEPDTGSRSQE